MTSAAFLKLCSCCEMLVPAEFLVVGRCCEMLACSELRVLCSSCVVLVFPEHHGFGCVLTTFDLMKEFDVLVFPELLVCV